MHLVQGRLVHVLSHLAEGLLLPECLLRGREVRVAPKTTRMAVAPLLLVEWTTEVLMISHVLTHVPEPLPGIGATSPPASAPLLLAGGQARVAPGVGCVWHRWWGPC